MDKYDQYTPSIKDIVHRVSFTVTIKDIYLAKDGMFLRSSLIRAPSEALPTLRGDPRHKPSGIGSAWKRY